MSEQSFSISLDDTLSNKLLDVGRLGGDVAQQLYDHFSGLEGLIPDLGTSNFITQTNTLLSSFGLVKGSLEELFTLGGEGDPISTMLNKMDTSGQEMASQVLNSIIPSISEFTNVNTLMDQGLALLGPNFQGAQTFATNLMTQFDQTRDAGAGFLSSLDNLSLGSTSIKGVIGGLKGGVKGLWTTLRANPIGAIITAGQFLVNIFVSMYQKVGWFRGGVQAAFSIISNFGSLLWDNIVGAVKNIISGLGMLGSAIGALFSGEFSKAGDLAAEGFSKLGKGLAVANPVGMAITTGMDIADDAERIAAEAGESYKKGFSEASGEGMLGVVSDVIPGAEGIIDEFTGTEGLEQASSAVGAGIVSGGPKHNVNNLSIGNLIENVTQHVSDGVASAEEITDMVIEEISNQMHGLVRVTS